MGAATDASTAQHAEHAKHDSRSEIRHGHRQVHPSRHREESSHEGAGRSVHLRLHPDARRSRESPKDHGMLIELPVQQIKTYMGSFEALQMKVKEAHDHLMQAQM